MADEILVQVSYAIGVAKPMNLYINTYGTSKVKIADFGRKEIELAEYEMPGLMSLR